MNQQTPENEPLQTAVTNLVDFSTTAALVTAYTTALAAGFSKLTTNTNVAAFSHIHSEAFIDTLRKTQLDADTAACNLMTSLAAATTSEELKEAFDNFLDIFTAAMDAAVEGFEQDHPNFNNQVRLLVDIKEKLKEPLNPISAGGTQTDLFTTEDFNRMQLAAAASVNPLGEEEHAVVDDCHRSSPAHYDSSTSTSDYSGSSTDACSSSD